jgi:hypothetical protein
MTVSVMHWEDKLQVSKYVKGTACYSPTHRREDNIKIYKKGTAGRGRDLIKPTED